MAIQNHLDTFRATVAECVSHITFAHQKYANSSYKHQKPLRIFIAESAYLKIFIAWETFLENCFIDYLLNEPSINNNRPAKWVSPLNREHANKIVIGAQTYMD